MTKKVFDGGKRTAAPLTGLVLLLTVTIMLGAVPSTPTKALQTAQIELNPSSGPPGTNVTVTVSGPGEWGSCELHFNGEFVHIFEGNVPLVTDFIVPNVAPGPHPVRVYGFILLYGIPYIFDLTATFDGTELIPPEISAPTVTYEEGTTGHRLRWTPEDPEPGSYTIYNNLMVVQHSESWTTGETIECNIDGLAVGTYNFTLVVCNVYGSCATDTVWVRVYPRTSPAPAPLFPNVLRILPLAILAGALVVLHRRRKHRSTN